MRITNAAIRKHPMVFAFMVIIIVIGINSYLKLPRESTPDVKIPFVMVIAPYTGASPEDMENLVTRKIEQELKGLNDLEEMTSSSVYGMSQILLEFTTEVDMIDALQKVRDRVELAKPELPDETREDLQIIEISADDWPIVQVVLSGDYDLATLKKVGEDLQEEIEQIQGVLGVDLTGGIENEVQVDVDPQRLRFYDLGLVDVQDAITFQNTTIPGGKLSLGTYDYQVRVPGEVEAVEEILGFVINLGIEPPVYIRDVATVRFGVKDRESISRINQRDAVTLSVKKRSGENIIDIADEVHRTIDRLRPTFPAGTEVHIVGDQSEFVRDMVSELENNILSGLLLVVAVLFAFLGFTNAVFVGVAIPFSMLISFIVLRGLGITLNMVVLFSLILALGMLVDNAIVIVENIFRHRGKGKGADEAASFGASQVSGAVIASTLTTICAFGPLVIWPGIMGEFMSYLPITVIITLAASLLVALVFNPVLCSRFMAVPRPQTGRERLGDRLLRYGLGSYRPAITWALQHRALVLAGAVLVLLGTFVLFGFFNSGVELFPDTDPSVAFVNIDAPSGTRIEVSDTYTRTVEAEVARLNDLKAFTGQVGATAGGGLTGNAGAPTHQSVVTMEFVDMEERQESSRNQLEKLRSWLREFTGARIVVEKMEEGPPTGRPVNIELSGDDFEVLGELASQVKERIRNLPGLVDIQDNFDRGLPEIEIRPDVERAGRYGLQTWDIASTVRTALHGFETAKYRIGEDEYDIVVRYQEPFRKKMEDLQNMSFFYEGENIPLSAFADTRFRSSLAAIHRIDARRVVTIGADVAAGFNANALLAQVQGELNDFRLPPGYTIEYTGESEDQEEAEAFLSDAFAVAIMLILLVLISQFGSVTVPLVIISSVVLSLIGVLWGLMITGTAFGIIMTGVGVISLAGIVVNNAIVLLTYIGQLRERGLEKAEAIVRAGMTRFRPVILTAVTTILGLIPLTTGFSIDFERLVHADFAHAVIIGGESSQWWGPMGVAVIWGLAVATFLTLIVVPVMYSSLDPIKRGLYLVFIDSWLRFFRRGSDQPQ